MSVSLKYDTAPTESTVAAAASAPGVARPRGGRIPVLDGLRFVAASSVVLFHLSTMIFPWGDHRPSENLWTPYYQATSYGWLGVELFFMISGFVICMSSWGRSIGQFLVSRATRLYPAYWFAVLLTSLVVFLVAGGIGSRSPGGWDIVANLTMFQEPLGSVDVDSVYWTLWVEMRFYLIFSIVVFMGVTYRRVVVFCVVWTLGALLATGTDAGVLKYVLVPTSAPFFVAGIAYFLMYRYGPSPVLWVIIGFNFLIGQRTVIDRHHDAEVGMSEYHQQWATHMIVAVFFVVMAALALGWFDRVTFPWLTTLGGLTYPLYLVHCEMSWVIIKELRDDYPPSVLISTLAAAAVLMATLVYVVIEKRLAPRFARAMRGALARMPDA
ncbi:acyltransferase family protein [Yinghuangia seranimata]|uniref:acyltransferase family protein n=1 Tax=Yinghuangia seranimata TaxID=408067 RepID=UPI00248B816E|nr:acyltransferase [Yinghuangia seranimata]MDI2130243.1 acyltransferase [Yinghuangia seranimata]